MNVPFEILEKVRTYYGTTIVTHGPTPRGVDWKSEASQIIRFQQFDRLLEGAADASVLDFGCGYGALLTHLRASGWVGRYVGFDIAPAMLEAARSVIGDDGEFVSSLGSDVECEYAFASGVFNVRLDIADDAWESHIASTLETMDDVSSRGFAFNMLTSYSDPEKKRPDLYYARASTYFDHCVERFSRDVALLHDYGLYEFTIMVRK